MSGTDESFILLDYYKIEWILLNKGKQVFMYNILKTKQEIAELEYEDKYFALFKILKKEEENIENEKAINNFE
jgi:hypothetical protein